MQARPALLTEAVRSRVRDHASRLSAPPSLSFELRRVGDVRKRDQKVPAVRPAFRARSRVTGARPARSERHVLRPIVGRHLGNRSSRSSFAGRAGRRGPGETVDGGPRERPSGRRSPVRRGSRAIPTRGSPRVDPAARHEVLDVEPSCSHRLSRHRGRRAGGGRARPVGDGKDPVLPGHLRSRSPERSFSRSPSPWRRARLGERARVQ